MSTKKLFREELIALLQDAAYAESQLYLREAIQTLDSGELGSAARAVREARPLRLASVSESALVEFVGGEDRLKALLDKVNEGVK